MIQSLRELGSGGDGLLGRRLKISGMTAVTAILANRDLEFLISSDRQ